MKKIFYLINPVSLELLNISMQSHWSFPFPEFLSSTLEELWLLAVALAAAVPQLVYRSRGTNYIYVLVLMQTTLLKFSSH